MLTRLLNAPAPLLTTPSSLFGGPSRLLVARPSLLGLVSGLLAPALCWGCGDVSRRSEPLCLRCRRTLRHLGDEEINPTGVRIWSAVAYEGAARELVRGMKFRGAMAIADAMAAVIVANAPESVLPPVPSSGGEHFGPPSAAVLPGRPTAAFARAVPSASVPFDRPAPALVPVPVHPARQRRRGFNQAAVLAEALARRTGVAVADCLLRSGTAASQVGRPRGARLSAPPGRIHAGRPAPVRAVLVDDVATTGATLAACARALRAAGARHIRAITFARTLGR